MEYPPNGHFRLGLGRRGAILTLGFFERFVEASRRKRREA